MEAPIPPLLYPVFLFMAFEYPRVGLIRLENTDQLLVELRASIK